MSTTEGGAEARYRILPTPPPPDAEGPRLQEVPPEEEVDDYVIEDLEAADSPTGGAAIRCHGCYCTGW